MDLGLLNQRLNSLLYNTDEAIRKWVDFIQAPAGDVNFQYYDSNGNLQTAVFPNRNKLVNDFMVNVNSVMTKTFYVDAVNGDDLNDGSQTTPFRTLTKAIDSVPVGGVGVIVLASGQIFTINEDVEIIRKNITITSADITNKARVKFAENVLSDNTRALSSFVISDAVLTFLYTDIEIPAITNTTLPKNSKYGTAILPTNGDKAGSIEVNLYWSTLILDGDYSFIDTTNAGTGAPPVTLESHGADITVNSTTSHLIQLNSNNLALLKCNFTITDNTATGITINSLIAGVVKDTNGVPRNVISNLIL